jgi:hypothetical protein
MRSPGRTNSFTYLILAGASSRIQRSGGVKNSESKCVPRNGARCSTESKVATRLSSRLDEYRLDQAEEIRRSFEGLIGKPAGENLHLVPSSLRIAD